MNEEARNHHNEARRKVRARVETLLSGGAPKRLTPRARLEAAAYISALVAKIRANEDGPSVTSLCAMLGERMSDSLERSSREPFRLHRWMLKAGVTEVTKDVAASYAHRAEPLRTTSTYLLLLEHLAPLAGLDVLDTQSDLLTRLNIADGPRGAKMDEPEAAQKLAQKLHQHAAAMARNLDLARLFQRAEQLQVGWDPTVGADARTDLVSHDSAYFRAKEPVASRWWLEVAAPPLPSVKVARLAFGRLTGVFRLTDEDSNVQELEGEATAYWDLHVALGPTGPLTVGALFLRSTSVDLRFLERSFCLPELQDDVYQFVSGYPSMPCIEWEARTWKVSCDAEPQYKAQPGASDVEPPSATVPNIRLEPVTPSTITAWLLSTQAPEDIDLLPMPPGTPTGWIRVESFARSVEAAIRDGRMDALYSDWILRYTRGLDDFELEWRRDCAEGDAALRVRYQEAELKGDQA